MTAPSPNDSTDAIDRECMVRAIAAASMVRCITSPNPWVGAVLRSADGSMFTGATEAPGGAHAEIVALRAAGSAAAGATLYVTLEPCSHTGRTGPCTDAIIDAGVRRVVIGVVDPDEQVSGSGVERLRAAGIDVTVGVKADHVTAQLTAYLKHRRTGRPYVVLKLAATLDGGTAAPNGSSQWISSPEARADGHVVEEAEAHRPPPLGVMARRSHGAERGGGLAAHHEVDAEHHRTGGVPRGGQRVRVERGVGVEVMQALLGTRRLELVQVGRAVHARDRRLRHGVQRAQHLGDRLSALEGGNLDPAAHVGGDVDRQPGGKFGGGVRARRWTVWRLDPAFRIGRPGRKTAFRGPLAHVAILVTSAASAAISRA